MKIISGFKNFCCKRKIRINIRLLEIFCYMLQPLIDTSMFYRNPYEKNLPTLRVNLEAPS